jgi:hypothetical protein
MKIKLDNFSATIDVESVEITSVTDNVKAKTASVNLVINQKYGTTLDGFIYTKSWEDSEVLSWATNELNKYEVE